MRSSAGVNSNDNVKILGRSKSHTTVKQYHTYLTIINILLNVSEGQRLLKG